MKIKVEFESLDEFKEYMGIVSPSLAAAPAQAEPETTAEPELAQGDPQEAAQSAQEDAEAPQPKNDTTKTQEAAPAENEAAPDPDPEPEQPAKVTEDFRIVVRKQLAALNKKCGYNRAAELIKELTGKNKLTEVNLADLPKVMDHAKEETNAD